MSDDLSPGMTNAELESAIAMAFAMAGRSDPTEERYHAAMAHLRKLLTIQSRRANLMETLQ